MFWLCKDKLDWIGWRTLDIADVRSQISNWITDSETGGIVRCVLFWHNLYDYRTNEVATKCSHQWKGWVLLFPLSRRQISKSISENQGDLFTLGLLNYNAPVDQKDNGWHRSGTLSYRSPVSAEWRSLGNQPERWELRTPIKSKRKKSFTQIPK